MKIYALIGPSGTGKSYRALMVAYEKGIDYIIDDGILIHKSKILAGTSAKRSRTSMEAVKRAIFEYEGQKSEVMHELERQKPNKLLIIGTSENMISKIMERLELGFDYEKISIYDVASKQEIYQAKTTRALQGIHTVPLPTFELKSHFSGIIKNPVKLFFKTKDTDEVKEFEKTLIRPTFSYLGKYFISEKAIIQMIKHELEKSDFVQKAYNIEISKAQDGIEIEVTIGISLCRMHVEAAGLQRRVAASVEGMTLINVKVVDVRIIRVFY